jgi:AcrR family transcriptional regulator
VVETVKPRRRQARGERRIAQLLDAAAQVFAAEGYVAATMNAVAAAASVSPGTLYQFFPNKESMAEALAEHYLDALTAAQNEAGALEINTVPLDDVISNRCSHGRNASARPLSSGWTPPSRIACPKLIRADAASSPP